MVEKSVPHGMLYQYSHILDESRKENARLLENAFYSKAEDTKVKETKQPVTSNEKGITSETISKLMENPEIAELILKLSKAAGLG